VVLQAVIQELGLEADEAEIYTHKLYVIVADRAAVVYRLAPGQYAVIENEETDEQEEQAQEDEAFSVLMAVARYLEINMRAAKSEEAREEQPKNGAAYSAPGDSPLTAILAPWHATTGEAARTTRSSKIEALFSLVLEHCYYLLKLQYSPWVSACS